MIRRWSYINSINCGNLISSRAMQKATVDVNMNTLMYLKKKYTPATRLTRKRWARRKHIHNWIPNLNVLRDWAKSYRFYKNHNKLVYNQFFTKHSFLAFNLIGARNSIPALHKGSENLITGSYTRRLLKYFSAYSNPRLAFFQSFKNSRLLTVSCYSQPESPLDVTFFETNSSALPLFTDKLTAALPYETQRNPTDSPISYQVALFDLTFAVFKTQLLALYKTLVMLTFIKS
jgi:hypothetical protein